MPVGRSEDLAPGQVRGFAYGRREIVVLRTADGTLKAVASKCPHRGAELKYGKVQPLVTSHRFGEYELQSASVLRCPWHGFEYDVDDGCAVADGRFRAQTYAVREQNGELQVDVP